jgi:cytochrome bd-type quinol oxidase subunit 1
MSAILATGGLDDIAMAVGEAIIVGGFAVVGCLIAYSWWKRSLIAAVIACVLILADGAFFQPWTVIDPSPPPDAYGAYWLFRLRVISVFWVLLVIAAVVCLVRVIRRRKQKRERHVAAS